MDSTHTLGIGILGTGAAAAAHAENFQRIPGCHVVAAGSRDRLRARKFLRNHGLEGDGAHEDLEAFLAHPGLDIVCITTPHPLHPEQTMAAARAGKHVVIEKPVALDRQSLAAMVRAVREAGVHTSVCFELRWIGLFRNIKAIIEQGLIGRPFYGEASYFHGIGPWIAQHEWNRRRDQGGSALLTAGCHALDGLIWLMGEPVVEVAAMSGTSAANPLGYEYDPNAVIILRFRSGAIGKVAVSIECRQPYHFPLVIQGDRGTVRDDRLATLELPGTRGWATVPTDRPESGDVKDHPYRGQFEAFVQGIRNDVPVHNSLEATAHVHEVMFAAEAAIRQGATVRVSQTPDATGSGSGA